MKIEKKHSYYTAVGHFRRKRGARGQSRPVILIGRKEYPVDIQEMTVWTALSWRILDFRALEVEYNKLAQECGVMPCRTLEDCLSRLCTRGLTARGMGDTQFEALYDLLGTLYVVPLSESLPLRLFTFCKLTLCRDVSISKAKELFRRDRPNQQEAQVMALARQALLSTAELVQCAQVGVKDVSTGEKIMDALYNDDHTTDLNIADTMLTARSRESVTLAVANLYLRKQIVFERV